MALFDAQLLFSDAQGPFNTGTNASTNDIDLLVDRDVGKGRPLELLITVVTAVTGTNSTCDIRLVTDDNSSFSSATVLWSTGALAVAALPAGKQFAVKVPRGTERYLRVQYVVASANQDTGKFTAGLVTNVDDQKTYPRASYSVA